MKRAATRGLLRLAAGMMLFGTVTGGGTMLSIGAPGPLLPSPEQQKSGKRNDTGYLLQKLKEWREASEQHVAGKPDPAAVSMGKWDPEDCEIVIDFITELAGKSKDIKRGTLSKTPFRRRMGVTKQEIQQGDLNRVLKEGALLHTDIALLNLETDEYLDRNNGVGLFVDGRVIGVPRKFHWSFARRLIDAVAPSPSRDETARMWYIATTAYMMNHRHLANARGNLEKAENLYPSDDRILFYTGVLHETWAHPSNQNAHMPPGSSTSYGSEKSELRKARQLFRKAIKVNPGLAEAHLRLGRVHGLLGNHREAIEELRKAAGLIGEDTQLRYYNALFLGWSFAETSRWKEARDHYKRAAELYPTAQSPLFGLSRLARIGNDAEGARAAVERVFELPSDESPGHNDPWWRYDLSHVRDAEALVAKMHAMFTKPPEIR